MFYYLIFILVLISNLFLITKNQNVRFIKDVKVMADGNLVSASTENRSITIWNYNTYECIRTLRGYTDWVVSLDILQNKNIISGSTGKKNSIMIWNSTTFENTANIDFSLGIIRLIVLKNGDIAIADFSDDMNIKIYNHETLQVVANLTRHGLFIRSLTVLPNGDLVSSGWDGKIHVYDHLTYDLIEDLDTYDVEALAVMKNGSLISGCIGISIWDKNFKNTTHTLRECNQPACVCALAILPNGNIVSGLLEPDYNIRILNPNTFDLIGILVGHTNYVTNFAVMTNGYLASSGHDNTLKIWDVENFKMKANLTEENYC